MKVSEMIKNLQEFMNECGDLDCYYAVDDEGNDYHEVYYKPSLYCVTHCDGEVCSLEDADWMELAPDDYIKICVVN